MHWKDQITEELTFALGEMKISVFIEEKLTSKQHLLWWIFFPLFRAQSWLSRTPTPGLSCNRSADVPEGQWKYFSVLLEHHLLRNTHPWVQCHRVSQWHQAPNQLSHFPNESPPEYFKYKEPETVYLLCFFCHPLPLLGGHASQVSSKISGFKAEEPGRDGQSSTLLDESVCIWNISIWLQVYLLIHSSTLCNSIFPQSAVIQQSTCLCFHSAEYTWKTVGNSTSQTWVRNIFFLEKCRQRSVRIKHSEIANIKQV